MEKTVNNDRKMTRTTKKKVALAPEDQQAKALNTDDARANTVVEVTHEDDTPAPDVHPLFLSVQHTQACKQLMEDLSSTTSAVCWLNFASTLLKDHYLELMKPQLRHRHANVVEVHEDQDLLELINQLAQGISLELAMKNPVSGQAKKLLLIPCPEQLGQENWDLLFTLARDFPALNIAYLLCWSDQRQQDSPMLKSLRAAAAMYEFTSISQSSSQLILHLETEAGMSVERREELNRLLDSIVVSPEGNTDP